MSAIVTASGYGLTVSVKRGHLIVEDGVATNRRKRRFNRAKPRIERLIVHGHSGSVTLDALRWLRDIGASFVQIDHDGAVVATSTPGHHADPRIVVAQVEARENGRALSIVRRLIARKIEGQIRNLHYLDADPQLIDFVLGHLRAVREATSFEELRAAEGPAGKQYWRAWEGLSVRFEPSDLHKIPEHWRVFNRRRSTLSESNRKAIDPANAILNYVFGVLKAEVHMEALRWGLNPYLGLMHSDVRFRSALALDLVEPLRPQAERRVLELLGMRTFGANDFFETREGVCRVMPPLPSSLATSIEPVCRGLRKLVRQIRRTLTQSGQHARGVGRRE